MEEIARRTVTNLFRKKAAQRLRKIQARVEGLRNQQARENVSLVEASLVRPLETLRSSRILLDQYNRQEKEFGQNANLFRGHKVLNRCNSVILVPPEPGMGGLGNIKKCYYTLVYYSYAVTVAFGILDPSKCRIERHAR